MKKKKIFFPDECVEKIKAMFKLVLLGQPFPYQLSFEYELGENKYYGTILASYEEKTVAEIDEVTRTLINEKYHDCSRDTVGKIMKAEREKSLPSKKKGQGYTNISYVPKNRRGR